MTEITLADYVGHIFLEIVKAREMADHYSRQVGESYAKDSIMRYFSAPRFKVSDIELTIPVLVSGARISQAIRFRVSFEEFASYISGQSDDVIRSVKMMLEGAERRPVSDGKSSKTRAPRRAGQASSRDSLVKEFFKQLEQNIDPRYPNNIVALMWRDIFFSTLKEGGLIDAYEKHDPNGDLLKKTTAHVLNWVTSNTVVESTAIDNLLINPETNIVKSGSSDTSVFTITAKMVEEGFFIHSIKDEATGVERPIVDFE